MIKNNVKNHLFTVLESLVITGIVLLSLSPLSCRMTPEGVKLLAGDYTPPVIKEFKVIDSTKLNVIFSKSIQLDGCVVSPFIEGISDSSEHSETESLSEAIAAASGAYGSIPVTINYSEDNTNIEILLSEEMEIGKKYELYGVVKDETGNSLTFSVPFVGYNSRIPKIIMTEIQSESVSSQSKDEKNEGIYRTEFIEFLALSDGNLAGLEILSGYDGEKRKFSFPAVEVTKGEIFIVHFRNKGNGCINEIGEDLNLAKGGYAVDGVRDLWSEETSTALGNKTDVIIVLNRSDGIVSDAIFYRDEEILEWTKSMEEYAVIAVESGIYSNSEIEEAFLTNELTASKTIVRKNAVDLRNLVLSNEEIDFSVLSNKDNWMISSKPNPGDL